MDVLTILPNEILIYIPAVYVFGMILKSMKKVPDNYIPLLLLVCSVVLMAFIYGFSANTFLYALIITGLAVYGNQVFVQFKKNVSESGSDDTQG